MTAIPLTDDDCGAGPHLSHTRGEFVDITSFGEVGVGVLVNAAAVHGAWPIGFDSRG